MASKNGADWEENLGIKMTTSLLFIKDVIRIPSTLFYINIICLENSFVKYR